MYLSKKEYERLREIEKVNETALTFDALEMIVRSCDFNAEEIGRHFLECYYRQKRNKTVK